MDSKMDSMLKANKEELAALRADMKQWMAAMENQWKLQQHSVIELEQDDENHGDRRKEVPVVNNPIIICNPEEKFPDLDEDNPRGWVRSCNEYFQRYRIPENLKMDYVALHVKGKIDHWFEGYMWDHDGMVSWAEFSVDICRRFNLPRTSVDEEELKLCKQVYGVEKYIDAIEELKEQKLSRAKFSVDICRRFNLPKTSVDEEELKLCKQVHGVEKYIDAIEELKEQKLSRAEFSVDICRRFNLPRTSVDEEGFKLCKQVHGVEGLKEQKLCFFCKGKWQHGHKCKGRNMNAIFGIKETEEAGDEQEDEVSTETSEEAAEISLQEEVEGKCIDTIKFLGKVNEKSIVILIDTGSTHSFLSPQIVQDMKLKCALTSPVLVTVANGDQMICDIVCPKFQWTVQGEPFEKDIMLLTMSGCKCDMVLGMDWMDEFTPVQLDTRPLSISFNKGSRRITLYGILPGSESKK